MNGSELDSRLGTEVDGSNECPFEDDFVMVEECRKEGVLQIIYPYRTHKCVACWEMFSTPAALLKHLAVRHSDDKLRFKCRDCGRTKDGLKGIAIHYGLCIKGKILAPVIPVVSVEDPARKAECPACAGGLKK